MGPLITLLLSYLFTLSAAETLATAKVDIPEEKYMNFSQITAKYGWESEHFTVTTEDGYILKLFHLKGNEGNTPVLLMHGQADSSDTFIIRGNSSIAITLANEGYDIWFGNVRGNKYSRSHVSLSPDHDIRKFWNFSFNEIALYDLPATIDFILNETGKDQLSAIGHSMGTTIFFILGSEKPEYNSKISVFIALAPIAYMSNMPPLVEEFLTRTWPAVSTILEAFGIEELLSHRGQSDDVAQIVCSLGMLGYDICEVGISSLVTGEDVNRAEPEFFQIVIGHFLSGTARKVTDHYSQISRSGRFAKFDYGLMNPVHYGMNKELLKGPPAYNLNAITMPIALMTGGKDKMGQVHNVMKLKSQLSNAYYYYYEGFNHGDFIWGNDLKTTLIPTIIDFLVKFN